jgi:hypothetical protein
VQQCAGGSGGSAAAEGGKRQGVAPPCAEGLGQGWRLRKAAGRRAVEEATNRGMCMCSKGQVGARTKPRSFCTAFCDVLGLREGDRTISEIVF